MKILNLARCGVAALAGAAFAQPAAAAVTTLDFSGAVCGVAGNQTCGDGSQIGQDYGDGTGVAVSYRNFNSTTGVTQLNYLQYWRGGYGDLTGVVYNGGGASTYTSEITFTALAGYELRILGFDAGCYSNRPTCQTFPFTVSEIGGVTAATGDISPPAGDHSSLSFDHAYSQSGYVLRWGPDGYDGGLDNIRFDVRAIGVGAIPEPATWALLILGFGTIGGAMRRRAALGRETKARLRFAG